MVAIAGRSTVLSNAHAVGAFYTCRTATQLMTEWAVRTGRERVLEPCFGSGSFLSSLDAYCRTRGYHGVRIFGVELVKATFEAVVADLLTPETAICDDFLNVKPFPVDVVIGNPPYVRLRHLPEDQRARALRAAEEGLGGPMDTSGSVWMAFVIHALRFLKQGGRLTLVLPSDFTYVRYARPLWEKLSKAFGSLRVVRVRERLFPDIYQDVVLLFADDYGRSTTHVTFQAYDNIDNLLTGTPDIDVLIAVQEIVSGKRPFQYALLPTSLQDLLTSTLFAKTHSVRQVCSFNIGYVSGDKRFFHPNRQEVLEYQIPQSSLRPSITSSRQISEAGLFTSNINPDLTDKLFFPPDAENLLTDGELEYVKEGKNRGVDRRYKCQVRDPWFLVPGVKVPDLMLTVFSERPIVLINDRDYVATNSLLCGYLRGVTAEEFAAAWYNSLSLLFCELEIHSLGGGLMILVPNEVGNVRTPSVTHLPRGYLKSLDAGLRKRDLMRIYQAGDEEILKGLLKFKSVQIDMVREGISILERWRTSSRTCNPSNGVESPGGESKELFEDIHE